ncbi:MAG: serine hydrolase domain-containing protein [Actinomycetota bacterium]
MAEIHGTVSDDRFAPMAELLSATLDSDDPVARDVGASVCVTVGGETVVDIWGGHVDEAKTTPWQQDTITNVWSTTKTMTFLTALTLVERGELDLYAPVAEYWPEFAANGKQDIPVRHFFGHTSGVSAWAQPIQVEDIYDQSSAAAKLAAQEPWWEPGTASGYHALNQGHLIGEVVQRIDGRSLGTIFREDIAGPLGADFHIGLPESEFGRVSNVIPPPPGALPSEPDFDSVMMKTFTGPAPQAEVAWTTPWRQAEIGAANGHGNARSVANIQAIVANGGEHQGVKLLSKETIDLIFDEQAYGTDLVLQLPVRFGMGYALPSEGAPHLPEGRIAYWGGWGGSAIIVDTDRNMTIAYMMNDMHDGLSGDMRSYNLITAAYDAVGR